jgi:hypothetical protein
MYFRINRIIKVTGIKIYTDEKATPVVKKIIWKTVPYLHVYSYF